MYFFNEWKGTEVKRTPGDTVFSSSSSSADTLLYLLSPLFEVIYLLNGFMGYLCLANLSMLNIKFSHHILN